MTQDVGVISKRYDVMVASVPGLPRSRARFNYAHA